MVTAASLPQVVKLHQKLGKPIPSTEPVLVTTSGAATTSAGKATPSVSAASAKTGGSVPAVKPGVGATAPAAGAAAGAAARKVVATPKITFVGERPALADLRVDVGWLRSRIIAVCVRQIYIQCL